MDNYLKIDPSMSASEVFGIRVAQAKGLLLHKDIRKISTFGRELMVNAMSNNAEAVSLRNGFVCVENEKDWVFSDDQKIDIDDLVALAEYQPHAYDAARQLAARILQRGEKLPRNLLLWTVEVLNGKQCPPTPSDQRKGLGHEDFWRNEAIWWTVLSLVNSGMKATRNPASPHLSACDAVATAMRELGEKPTSYSGIYKVYGEFQSAVKGC